jgi:hypothetical protein
MSAIEQAIRVSNLSYGEILSILLEHFTFQEIVFLSYSDVMEFICD